jgi:hypothetical protein
MSAFCVMSAVGGATRLSGLHLVARLESRADHLDRRARSMNGARLGVNEGRLARREVTFLRWVVSGALIHSAELIVLPNVASAREDRSREVTREFQREPSVPIDRQDERRLSELSERSHKGARLWRP